MSDSEKIKVIPEEIDKVQKLVELCISRYMKKNEIMEILHQEKNIDPVYTECVWEKLEDENPKFFKAYTVSLILKDHIKRCNNLWDRHVALTHQLNGVVSNGFYKPPQHYNASYYAPENYNGNNWIKEENMEQSFPVGGFINNGGPAYIPPSYMQPRPLNMVFAQNSNGVAFNGHGDGMGNSRFVDEGNGGVLESNPAVSSFGIMESIPYDNQFHGTLMDVTRSSQLLRQLGHDTSPPDSTTPDITDTSTDTRRFDPNTSTNYDFQNHNFRRDA